MSICKGCGAKIIWIETKSGNKMPCDPEPLSWDDVDEGTLLVGEDGSVRRSVGINRDNDMAWYVSHFATCSKADEFRSKK